MGRIVLKHIWTESTISWQESINKKLFRPGWPIGDLTEEPITWDIREYSHNAVTSVSIEHVDKFPRVRCI